MKRDELKENYNAAFVDAKTAAIFGLSIFAALNPITLAVTTGVVAKQGLDYVIDIADGYLATPEQNSPTDAGVTPLSGDDFYLIDNSQ